MITSAIRVADALDGDGATGRGYYVEDAGYPVFADWLVESTQLPGQVRRLLRFAGNRLRGTARRVAEDRHLRRRRLADRPRPAVRRLAAAARAWAATSRTA